TRRSRCRRLPSARGSSRQVIENQQRPERGSSAGTAFATPFVNELRGSRTRGARPRPVKWCLARAWHVPGTICVPSAERLALLRRISAEEFVAETVDGDDEFRRLRV